MDVGSHHTVDKTRTERFDPLVQLCILSILIVDLLILADGPPISPVYGLFFSFATHISFLRSRFFSS